MNIITGASGQIGSYVVKELVRMQKPVRAIVRSPEKAMQFEKEGVEAGVADLQDSEAVKAAFEGAATVLLMTPENPASSNVIGDTIRIISNYRDAIRAADIKRVVALSSVGAQYSEGTGNLIQSHLLEEMVRELDIDYVIIRPSYYFSNWLAYRALAAQDGVLPTFFPTDLRMEMLSPADVAAFIASAIADTAMHGLYELTGPEDYSSNDVAEHFSRIVGRDVRAAEVPASEWEKTLRSAGFSDDAAHNLAAMTQAVLDGKTAPQGPAPVKLKTSLADYLSSLG